MVRPAQKRAAVRIMQKRNVSQRRACQEIGVSRSKMIYKPKQPDKDKPLAESIQSLSEKYPRFGYRRIAVMLGWQMKGQVSGFYF